MKHRAALVMSFGLVVVAAAQLSPNVAAASADVAPRRAFLTIERTDDDGRMVVLHGFPAIRRDGRVVAAFEQRGDFAPGALLLLDVATGATLARMPLPERVVSDDREYVTRTPSRAGVRRMNRWLASAGYVALAQLRVEADTVNDDSRIVRFEGEALDVVAHISYRAGDADPPLRVTVRDPRSHAMLADRRGDGVDVSYVAAAPDRSFVVLGNTQCACHCSRWPSIERLSPPGTEFNRD